MKMWAHLCVENKLISGFLLISALIMIPMVDIAFFVEGLKLMVVNKARPQLERFGSLEGGPWAHFYIFDLPLLEQTMQSTLCNHSLHTYVHTH